MSKKTLKDLRNVGKATLKDLDALNISSIAELAKQEASDLYRKLKSITKTSQDPCVWDVFAAIIHEAKTGEATNWWEWTAKRKELFQSEPQ